MYHNTSLKILEDMTNESRPDSNDRAIPDAYPLIRISIASGGTPNCRASPALASAMVRAPVLAGGGEIGGARSFVGLGIGLNFSRLKSMPSSSRVVYLTGLRHSPQASG